MTPTEIQKLASEIATAAPVPAWDTVPELVQMRHTITTTGVKGQFEHVLNFSQTVALYKQLYSEIEEREAQTKGLKEAIQAAVMVSGKDKIKCGDYRLNLITRQGSKKIVAEKLLEQGVSPTIIAKATEIGKASQYVDIRKDKD